MQPVQGCPGTNKWLLAAALDARKTPAQAKKIAVFEKRFVTVFPPETLISLTHYSLYFLISRSIDRDLNVTNLNLGQRNFLNSDLCPTDWKADLSSVDFESLSREAETN